MFDILEVTTTKLALKVSYAAAISYIERKGSGYADVREVFASEGTEEKYRLDGCVSEKSGEWSAPTQRFVIETVMHTLEECDEELSLKDCVALAWAVCHLLSSGFDAEATAFATKKLIKEDLVGRDGGDSRREEKTEEEKPEEEKRDDYDEKKTVTLKKLEFEIIHDAAMLGAHCMIDPSFKPDKSGSKKLGIAAKIALEHLRKELGEEGYKIM